VVAAAFLVALYGFGLGFYGPGIYLVALNSLHGWSVEELSSAITIYYVLGASFLFFWVGSLFDRYGARKMVLAGTVAMACGTVLLAHVTRPWHVYAAFVVMSVGWATMSGAAINIIVAPWFDKRRGLAVSWALNGASAGGVIIAPLLTFLTTRFGFAVAIESVNASMFTILIPVAMLVLRPKRPDEHDPGEGAPDAEKASIASPGEPSDFRLTTVLRSSAFLSISVPFALGLTAQVGFLTHQIAFLAPTTGTVATGWAVSMTTSAAVLGRIATGYRRPARPENRGLRQLHRPDAWDRDFGDGDHASFALHWVYVVRPWRREYDIAPRPPGSTGLSKAAFRPDRQSSGRN
jgi:MFS family permease